MPKDPKGREAPGYDRHVFICGHERPESAARPSCRNRGSLNLLSAIKAAAREEGLTNIRIQKSGCLDFCENGITCVVYPEGIWYRLNTEIDIKSLIQHIEDGATDSALLMGFQD